jgi:hypothetical protein
MFHNDRLIHGAQLWIEMGILFSITFHYRDQSPPGDSERPEMPGGADTTNSPQGRTRSPNGSSSGAPGRRVGAWYLLCFRGDLLLRGREVARWVQLGFEALPGGAPATAPKRPAERTI